MRGKWNWMALGVWVFVSCIMVGGFSVVHAATYDATGTWTYTTSDNWVNPGTADCSADPNETVTVSVTQSGDTVSVNINGKVYTGTVSDATYTGTTSYREDEGETTVTVTFTLTSDSAGSGTSTWSWSGDYGTSCNGGCDFALVKGSTDDSGDGGGGSGCLINSLFGI